MTGSTENDPSFNVLLVTVERVSPTTAVLLTPHHFLRLHELLQITTLILFTVIVPIFVLQIVTQNFRGLQTGRGFALFVVFIIMLDLVAAFGENVERPLPAVAAVIAAEVIMDLAHQRGCACVLLLAATGRRPLPAGFTAL